MKTTSRILKEYIKEDDKANEPQYIAACSIRELLTQIDTNAEVVPEN